RPGPLKDLPLDSFLPPNPNVPQRPNKRAYSPGGPALFSPQKRRILEEEGIFPSKESLRLTVRALPVRRDGGDSPVKRLDFGLPKNSPASARSPHSTPTLPTPAPEPISMRLTRQNTTSDASSSSTPIHTDNAQEMIDYFSWPSGNAPPRGAVTQTPRDIPLPVDPQSIHYPGFVVFQD
ncbi:hypothetical protein B0H14DRAFT_2254539, partial [Mycena olivaceomarginata]